MEFEFQILDGLQAWHTPVGDIVMKAVTSLGNGGIVWIALAVLLLLAPSRRRSGWILVFALLTDLLLCNVILKPAVGRVRPYEINQAVELLVARPVDASFPSGHTAASFASVAALYLAKERRLWIGALVLSVLIAFSRLYLYVHFPTDVLGGMLAGLLAGYLGYQAYTFLEKRRKKDGISANPGA